ncbi:glycine cleavage system protein H [Globicatella sulfidifaciens]|uniref:glycine cleavage system protein H n=1 Tax=Globicatella sulfidifaciens TaxID=136093 RepID=UPI002891FE88|nr:biotin/lipoyl-containing protein [Globicatella sulfidifaciens]MDT2767255.1 glycine cleavage system protein H [Globicatella sulfidifaciens]
MKKMTEQLWVLQEADQYIIGMTSRLQEEAGDVSYVNIANLGDIEADDTLLNLEASKAAIEVPSPLSGKIIKINEAAIDNPALLNSEEANDNWIAVLTDVDASEFDAL